eukprot:TRINITY_DN12170_c0_g1::TRINITY_DN12170_c0_g1_i1::g.26504::m.26504 TRINITY_DN12170_c0_g1::TRINITY_DN12170_c0_g1_i1::g.26504  ORF type:complete len:227 (+),score=18.18,sp/P31582/RAF2A_ARATH/38.42/7e-40,Ras/PF00071.17/1.3e-47,Miro/PF08477.8/1.5e-15,Arf/PF00025.16/7.4e-13,GTP_EFTU/PF00009.22/0.0073,Gtr1_RagA/PF04670.7/0.0016,MMR_HSR1/PF01926.18/0.013,SRPRB/PF09439.5/0.075 TRINITY_DN12170_c0_g1_i1:26-706(+)
MRRGSKNQKVDVKVVMLGTKDVGKTCIANRYLYGDFALTRSTIGASFTMKTCIVDGKPINLGIWDTAGEERFDSLANFYCRGAGGAIVCFDLTNRKSFDALLKWVNKIVEEADERCVVSIVGTKLDIVDADPSKRQVEASEAEEFAKANAASYFETSAKMNWNVEELFQDLAVRWKELKKTERKASTVPPTGPAPSLGANWMHDLQKDDVPVDLVQQQTSSRKCCS